MGIVYAWYSGETATLKKETSELLKTARGRAIFEHTFQGSNMICRDESPNGVDSLLTTAC